MELATENRRRHPRYPCDSVAEVLVFGNRALFRGRVRDLSESGCFIETRARLRPEVMRLVELRFHVKGLEMNAYAVARSIHPGQGAGFEFVTRDPRVDGSIREMIKRLNGDNLAA